MLASEIVLACNCPFFHSQIGKKWFRPEEASDLRKKVKKILVDEFRNAKRDDCVSENDPLSSISPQGERSVQPIEC